MSGDRAVVTGGAGVIGRALVERLVERGTTVRCIDLQPPPTWLPDDAQYVQGDLRTLDSSWISAFAPDAVFHLAATFERSEESPDFWRESAEHNVLVSRRVLDASMRTPTLRRLVFASSYLVYDPSLYLLGEPPSAPRPLEEGSPIAPRNVCGAAKLLHEHELSHAERAGGGAFTTVSARIFRVFGRGSRDVISRWVRSALAGEPIVTYGTDSFFDYVYADDVAEALLRLGDGSETGAVNIGTGRARRVREVVETLRAAFPGLATESHGDAGTWEASQASTTRLEAAIGWLPETTLEEGIERIIHYEREAAPEMRRRTTASRAVRVLVTSVSRKAPLVRAFREAFLALSVSGEVHGADADPLAPARVDVDSFWPMPSLGELSDDELAKELAAREVDLVVPTRDGELLRLAMLKDRLQAMGIAVAVADPAAVEACLDKAVFATRCAEADIATIPTATTLDDVDSELLVVKERFGAGSRSVGLGLSRDEAAMHAHTLAEPIYQPLVAGAEYSVDVFSSRHNGFVGGVARTRDRVFAGESQVTSFADRSDLVELARSAVDALGVTGHAVLQVIDEGHRPVIVECNVRIGGASPLAFAVGLKTPQYLVQELIGEAPTPLRLAPFPAQLIRRPDDLIVSG